MSPTPLDDRFAKETMVGHSASKSYPMRGWLLAGLVACCLAPRAWMAQRLDTLCNDAVFYVRLAEGFECGDLEAGLGQLRLNTYPPVLAGLHSLGLDWQTAGEMWGVALSSLTVLPLFGWLTRQFSERLAVVACLLYAVHPKLVESSPELIRDPTFWFLWSLSLYASWRAAAEARLRWYLLAGLFIGLALHTRFEGWSLYLPLIGWSMCRQFGIVSPDAHSGRRFERVLRAAARCALAAAVCPLLLLALNLTWLAKHPHWELGNFKRLEYVALWSQASWGAIHSGRRASDQQTPAEAPSAAPSESRAAPPISPPSISTTIEAPARMSLTRTLWMFVNALRRGFGALFGIGWLVGFICCPSLWLRRDHLILFVVAGCVGAGAWIHLWYAQATSSRYFLSVVLLALPCAATGCCGFCRRLELVATALLAVPPFARRHSLLSRSESRQYGWPRAIAVVAVGLLTLAANTTEVLAGQHPGRQREAALGRWILAEFGPGRRISTPVPIGLLGFYAQGTTIALTTEATAMENADLAVILPPQANPQEARQFSELARRRELRPIDPQRLPHGYDWRGVVVFARARATDL